MLGIFSFLVFYGIWMNLDYIAVQKWKQALIPYDRILVIQQSAIITIVFETVMIGGFLTHQFWLPKLKECFEMLGKNE